METCMFLCFDVMKAQKNARFHVFSPFSASFYPHYIIMVKGPYLHSIAAMITYSRE